MPAVPKPAATVILIREAAGGSIEVFLVKRSKKAAFMAETYVFPGGMVDPHQDLSPEVAACVRPWGGPAPVNPAYGAKELLPFRVCAARELFEESKVLLGYNREGMLLSFGNDTLRKEFDEYRRRLLSNEFALSTLCEREGITLALDRLYHYGHWITPELQPLRFDTHFFLAICPEGQEPEPDLEETTEGIWLSPVEAMRRNAGGTISLSPPAIVVMDELGRLGRYDEIIASLEGRHITAVRPLFVRLPGHVFVIFPWDPEYGRFANGDYSGPFDHGIIVSGEAPPTRVVFRNGLPVAYRKQ